MAKKYIKTLLMAAAMIAAFPAAAAEIADTVPVKTDSVKRKIPDGKYIFIPDSIQDDVLQLLKGGKRVVDDERKHDPNEKVIWKGDTIPMKLKTRNLGRFDRGLSNYLFIPKGDWGFGLTASYGEFSTDNLEVFNLLSDIDIKAHIFSIKPYFLYFIRNNLAVGLRFGYTSAKGDIGSFKVDIDEDMNFDLHDIGYRNESYTAALLFRQYIGIARRGRFGVFNEMELAFSSGNSDFIRPYNSEPLKTHTNYMEAALNFSPGVCVFIMKNVSFNVSFGVFGFYLRNEKQIENGESLGNRTTSGANFRFNIFNINFGIGIHI